MNGGLAQQGLPLSDAFDERSGIDGKTYRVQYFERAVFESHPENTPPFDVLLSLLGREKLAGRVTPGGPLPTIGSRAIAGGFAVTLHAVIDPGATGRYSKPKDGNRWIVVDVSIENTGQVPVDYNPFFFTLKTTDNREYNPTFASDAYSPLLSSGKQGPRETTRGYVIFEVPVAASRATLRYDPTLGKNPITFDIR